MRNTIALNCGLILVPPGEHHHPALAASLQAELMKLGFILDQPALAAVACAPADWLASYHHEILPHLRQILGAAKQHPPFYRNFPAEVMEMSHAELFLNAIVHYWSEGRWEPPQTLRERGFAFENVEFKTLALGSDSDLKQRFTQLASLNQSLSDQDKKILQWLIDNFRGQLTPPPSIPFKETLCILAANGLDVPVKTPTDVLRVAVYLSGGDISLPAVPKPMAKLPAPETLGNSPQYMQQYLQYAQRHREEERAKFKFKKFTRPQRRLLLTLLENTNPDPAEMQRHLGRWLRLGEILHVGEFAEKFPRSAEAFRQLRNQHKNARVRTFNAQVDLAFARNWTDGAALLATRPGEFARKLDWLLRTHDQQQVLDLFARTAGGVSAKVLVELYNHFAQRYKTAPRAVLLKGRGSKMKNLPALPPLPPDLVQNIGNTILTVMRQRIARLPPLGNVWIDPRLKDVPLPAAMRSVNTAIKTYVRGTRIPFRPEAKVVRPFIHWFDEHGIEDLDLSAGLYDESPRLLSHISWTGLKNLNCCHSGDVRHRKGPCAEYIDLSIADCLRHNVRYATIEVFNYNGRPLHTVKDCVFGLMEREHPQANEIFVPKTISNCMALANESTSVLVCIVDLKESCYIWADIEFNRLLPTLETAAGETAQSLHAFLHAPKMSIHDLLTLHAQCRGHLVNTPAEADHPFHWHDFVINYANAAAYTDF